MRRLLALVLLCLLLAAGPVAAMQSVPASSSRDTVSLVSDTDAVSPGTPFRIGLRIRLAPGWHTYWRNPGDAGVAPELDLALPKGRGGRADRLAGAAAARRGAADDLRLYRRGAAAGHHYASPRTSRLGHRRLPIPSPRRALAGVQADLRAGAGALHARPAIGRPPASRRRPRPRPRCSPPPTARIPRASPWHAHISRRTARCGCAGPELNAANVTVPGSSRRPPARSTTPRRSRCRPARRADPVAQAGTGVQAGCRSRRRAGGAGPQRAGDRRGGARHAGAPPPDLSMPLAPGAGLRLPRRADPEPDAVRVPGAGDEGARAGRRARRRGGCAGHALSYTAGVLAGLRRAWRRAAGSARGRGGGRLGVPVRLAGVRRGDGLAAVRRRAEPVRRVRDRQPAWPAPGSALAARGGHSGSFFTGLLAVLVATPCTAPFMGVAIAAGAGRAAGRDHRWCSWRWGWAWRRRMRCSPRCRRSARLAPSPGALDGPVCARGWPSRCTAPAPGWSGWSARRPGPAGVLGTVAGLVLLGFAAWVAGLGAAGDRARRAASPSRSPWRRCWLALRGAERDRRGAAAPAVAGSTAGAEAYSATRLAALRAEGRPVFVNMTAAWCVTCLVNERVAIASTPVRDAFAAHHVAYLKGDWTRQDRRDHRLPARARARRRAAVCLLPAGRAAARCAAADPDRADSAARAQLGLTVALLVAPGTAPDKVGATTSGQPG